LRRFLLLSLLLVLFLALLTGGAGYAMSEVTIFHPGNVLFPLQSFAEDQRSALIADPLQQATYRLSLVEQRLLDLAELKGSTGEEQAVEALYTALQNMVISMGDLPESELPTLRSRLAELLAEAGTIVGTLHPDSYKNPEVAEILEAYITSLEGMVGKPGQSANQPGTGELINEEFAQITPDLPGGEDEPVDLASAIDPVVVEFPEGSLGAEHDFFVLEGKHLELSCESCHVDGRYAGTPNLCEDCHDVDKPDPHFDFDCTTCHVPDGWEYVSFDHTISLATDCQSCHSAVMPTNHYSGQCSACHSTIAWIPATFNHKAVNATNCQNCHSAKRPSNHYSGQCSACHSTTAWKPATFNHKAVNTSNCQNCHSAKRPSNHYSGQCSACHSTTAWKPAKFSHSAANATNCQNCHNRPAGHSGGQCSACHSTSGWRPANFDHKAAGATDCQSCHKRPSGHSGGQCSACHTTSGWRPANFDHKAAGATDCQSCHQRPSGHSSGQCSNCHNTNRWGDVNVKNHSFPTNHGNANGECSKCHTEGTNNVNCYKCHDKGKMENKHAEKDIFNIAGRCLSCHPKGKNDDD